MDFRPWNENGLRKSVMSMGGVLLLSRMPLVRVVMLQGGCRWEDGRAHFE